MWFCLWFVETILALNIKLHDLQNDINVKGQ